MMPETFERSRLSAREDEILEAAIEGLTDIQIALRLDISQSTVNSYWVRIRGKLGQLSRTELVALALKQKARVELAEARAISDALQLQAHQHARITQDYTNAEIYRAALDAAPDAILVICDSNIIRYANDRFAAMFDYAAGEPVGQPFSALIPPRLRTSETVQAIEARGIDQTMRLGLDQALYGRRQNGSEFRITLSLDSRAVATGFISTLVVRDFVNEVDTRRRYASVVAGL